MDEGERGGEGEVRERGAGVGRGPVFLTLKCRATEGGAARTPAAPLRVAPHYRCGARRVNVAARAAPLAVALQLPQPRHRGWRRQKGLFG
jgi:hypothetical protein